MPEPQSKPQETRNLNSEDKKIYTSKRGKIYYFDQSLPDDTIYARVQELETQEEEEAKNKGGFLNTGGALGGSLIGGAFGGPVGAIAGGTAGSLLGTLGQKAYNPEMDNSRLLTNPAWEAGTGGLATVAVRLGGKFLWPPMQRHASAIAKALFKSGSVPNIIDSTGQIDTDVQKNLMKQSHRILNMPREQTPLEKFFGMPGRGVKVTNDIDPATGLPLYKKIISNANEAAHVRDIAKADKLLEGQEVSLGDVYKGINLARRQALEEAEGQIARDQSGRFMPHSTLTEGLETPAGSNPLLKQLFNPFKAKDKIPYSKFKDIAGQAKNLYDTTKNPMIKMAIPIMEQQLDLITHQVLGRVHPGKIVTPDRYKQVRNMITDVLLKEELRPQQIGAYVASAAGKSKWSIGRLADIISSKSSNKINRTIDIKNWRDRTGWSKSLEPASVINLFDSILNPNSEPLGSN